MKRINVYGVIIPNDYKWYFDYFDEDSTCPRDINNTLTEASGEEVEVYINSPGGVIDAGSEIYTMLREYQGDIKIKIVGQACSAASIIAMAGHCEMSPTALMMVHCVSTYAGGNHSDMEKTAEVLRIADDALSNAYMAKSGMSKKEVLDMMEKETWLTAEQAKEKGLIDGVMFEEKEPLRLTASNFELPSEEKMNRIKSMIEERENPAFLIQKSKLSLLRLKGEQTMNEEKYLEQRKALLDEADVFIKNKQVEEADTKLKEVEALDNQHEAIKLANANMNALKDKTIVTDLENKSVKVEGEKIVDGIIESKADNKKAYEMAWAKTMQGKSLEKSEQELFDKVNADFSNAYTHDTGNTAVLIPETVVAGIWSRATEGYPLLADVKKFNVKGTLTINKHTAIAAGDAAFYDEATATADEQNTFAQLSLTGCELAKAITVTWKLRSMATEEFIPYIISELGERVGVALGTAIAVGKGKPGESDQFKAEPLGIETALLAESNTPQVVSYDPEAATPDPLAYEDFTAAIGKIHSSYLAGSAIYASNATIWGQLANLVDSTGRALFIPDLTSGGVGRMFGFVVKADAGITDGSIIIGNANAGYVMNTNEPMSVATEEHVKARTVDYAAYTIVDGALLDNKAFALIRNTPAS